MAFAAGSSSARPATVLSTRAPLWDDVSALLQHQENGDASGLWSHFLDAIVLDQEQTVPGQIPRYTVIDGQLRLTTLQLLLAAAAKELEAVDAAHDAEWLRELAMNNPRKAEGVERLKVWPTNSNRAAFQAVMSPGGLPEGHVNDPGNLIDETFDYFCERAAEYLMGSDEDGVPTAQAAAGSGAVGERDGGGIGRRASEAPADHALRPVEGRLDHARGRRQPSGDL